MHGNRVVITGLGPLCSLGADARTFFSALAEGRSGITRVARLADCAVDIGGEVEEPLAASVIGSREQKLDRAAQLALVASATALADAGLEMPRSERAGVFLGSSRGVAELLEQQHAQYLSRGPEAVGPRASPHTTAGNLAGAVARHFGLRGPSLSVSAACASASQAIGLSLDLIRSGRADVMLAGGTEACLTPFSMAMFQAAGVLAQRKDAPAAASRPFDRDRDGIVAAEGAGVVVLESLEHAQARGARVYAELLGFGSACDAHSLTGVPADGEGLARAITQALEDARVSPDTVDYLNAHGTATRSGDPAETAAIKRAFGDHVRRLPISSTKSMTGHLIGAAGGIEAIACAMAIQEGVVPPTINLDHPDSACDLDYVPHAARPRTVRVAASISMGFGGNNACLILRAR
jgi:3-oxoacyl-[acyl-carrier-protein] synthase II